MNFDLSELSNKELRARMVQITNESDYTLSMNREWCDKYNNLVTQRFCSTKKLLMAKFNLEHYSHIRELLEEYGKILIDEQNKRLS